MQLRYLSRLSIAAATAGLILLAAGSLYLVAAFRDHVAAVATLNQLQFAVAELGVKVGQLDVDAQTTLNVAATKKNLDQVRAALRDLDHPLTAAARRHAEEIEAALPGFRFAPGTADPEARATLKQRLDHLRRLESRLTLAESAILQDRHRLLDHRMIVAVAVFGGVALAFGLLSIAGFRIIHRRILGPVQALTSATRAVERGDLEHPVIDTTNDEFARLSRAFNSMLAQLRHRDQEAHDYQRELTRILTERTAVLDALPAHIALLDSEGVIQDINKRWRHFARANNYTDPEFGVGRNYLTICEQAAGAWSDEAKVVATGIRAVLASERDEFALEYPCHSPDRKRWFRVMTTRIEPVVDAGDEAVMAGAVVAHIDITERRLAEEHVQEQAYLLQTAGRLAGFGGWSTNLATEEVAMSDEIAAIVDLPHGPSITVAEAIMDFYAEGSRERLRACWEACVAHGTPWDEELEIITAHGRPIWVRLTGEAVRDEAGRITHVHGALQDITAYKHIESELRRLAYEDALTGLASRLGFQTRLSGLLTDSATAGGHLTIIDLKGLNDVNQAYGYAFGDQLLIAVARRLKTATEEPGLVGRVGGDQFALLHFRTEGTPASVHNLVDWLEDLFRDAFEIDGTHLRMRATFGVAALEAADIDGEQVMRRAHLAFHAAREYDDRHWEVYQPALNEAAIERIRLTEDLDLALSRNQFELHFQPKVRLQDGQVVSAEALIRWRHPAHGLVPPDRFIPLAERSRAILPIGEWVIREACLRLREWQREAFAGAKVAINVSMLQLTDSDLAATVGRIVRETGVEPGGLLLEITESLLEHEPDIVGRQLSRLHDIGVRLSLDDFGTGYSSLGHLNRYPFDEIKIDRVFTAGCTTQSYSREIINLVIGLARVLGCEVVAEGIETAAQGDVLHQLGCHVGQGFYYSFPLKAEELHGLLASRQRLPIEMNGSPTH